MHDRGSSKGMPKGETKMNMRDYTENDWMAFNGTEAPDDGRAPQIAYEQDGPDGIVASADQTGAFLYITRTQEQVDEGEGEMWHRPSCFDEAVTLLKELPWKELIGLDRLRQLGFTEC